MAESTGADAPEWVSSYEAGLAAYEAATGRRAVRLFEATAQLAVVSIAIRNPGWNGAAPALSTTPDDGCPFQYSIKDVIRG